MSNIMAKEFMEERELRKFLEDHLDDLESFSFK